LEGCEQVVMGSVDSDGTDGPGHQFVDESYAEIPVLTGGMVDSSTLARAKAAGIDLRAALKRHDTSPALYQLDDGIVATPAMSMGDLSVTLILGRRNV
jgi:glycerate 2-kinase